MKNAHTILAALGLIMPLASVSGCEDPPGEGTLIVAINFLGPTGSPLDGLTAPCVSVVVA